MIVPMQADHVVAEAAGPPSVEPRSAGTAIRIEIQALRALAVVLVVIFHLWPQRLPGGYVGVDVFFVISGFLITSHLLGEVDRTGRISIPRFWARRARRLLPASLLVLGVVAIATITLTPDTYWRQYMEEIAAAATYRENWLLASNAVDYLAADNTPSPVQHFWSLSAEEQFYLVWPVLLVLAAVVTRGRSVRRRRIALIAVMTAITVISLAVSIGWTYRRQPEAYFVTPTRMWEFGLGGLLAFLPVAVTTARPALRAAACAAGLAAIGLSALLFAGTSPFPGYIALLPVVGTALVIAAGNPSSRWSPTRLMGFRPVQLVGDVSYSFYLWHWPLIVLIPIVFAAPLSGSDKVLIFGASMALAWVTKVFVEDRFRTPRDVSRARPRRVFATAILATLVVVGISAASISVLDARNDRDQAQVVAATANDCFGAAALEPANGCAEPFAPTGVMTPAFAKTDMNLVADPDGGWQCETVSGSDALRPCTSGATAAPDRTIAMLGDSHAMHYRAALTEIAERRNWQVVTYFKSACSGTGDPEVMLRSTEDQDACASWGAKALSAIASNPAIDTVVFANVSSAYHQGDATTPIGPDPYAAAWRQLTDAGKNVLALADVPRTFGGDVPDCLATATGDPSKCDAPVSAALVYDAVADAAASSPDASVKLLDLTDKFCRDGTCHARIGGVIVYSDSSHLTATYARTLAPSIEAALTGF